MAAGRGDDEGNMIGKAGGRQPEGVNPAAEIGGDDELGDRWPSRVLDIILMKVHRRVLIVCDAEVGGVVVPHSPGDRCRRAVDQPQIPGVVTAAADLELLQPPVEMITSAGGRGQSNRPGGCAKSDQPRPDKLIRDVEADAAVGE